MGQCEGTSGRTGERCKRVAVTGTATCSYHSPEAADARRARRAAASASPVQISGPRHFTTKLLSSGTWDDFEALFAPGTGWGRCACLFALDAPRKTRGGTWAQQREVNLATMRGLLEQRRSHGIIVYDADAPVGWCQFVHRDQLRRAVSAGTGSDWYLTCLVVEPRHRGLGVTSAAVRAAIEAIAAEGGGVVEAHATAVVPGSPPSSDRKDVHVEDDVLFIGGTGTVRYGVELDGVGPVAALYRSRRSMHNAALGGTVELYRREDFEAVAVLPRPKSSLADRVRMRRTL